MMRAVDARWRRRDVRGLSPMIRMIRDFCDSDKEDIKDWTTFIEIIAKIDRLVDVFKTRNDCGVECLNFPF